MTEKELIELKINSIYKELNKSFEIEPIEGNRMKILKNKNEPQKFVILTVRSYVDILIEFHKDNEIILECKLRNEEEVSRKIHELVS